VTPTGRQLIRSSTHWRSIRKPKFSTHRPPDGLIGEVKPALSEQLLHLSVAQGEAEVEPDRVLDDLRRKAMAAIVKRRHTATEIGLNARRKAIAGTAAVTAASNSTNAALAS
jgi:hypothetical protein